MLFKNTDYIKTTASRWRTHVRRGERGRPDGAVWRFSPNRPCHGHAAQRPCAWAFMPERGRPRCPRGLHTRVHCRRVQMTPMPPCLEASATERNRPPALHSAAHGGRRRGTKPVPKGCAACGSLHAARSCPRDCGDSEQVRGHAAGSGGAAAVTGGSGAHCSVSSRRRWSPDPARVTKPSGIKQTLPRAPAARDARAGGSGDAVGRGCPRELGEEGPRSLRAVSHSCTWVYDSLHIQQFLKGTEAQREFSDRASSDVDQAPSCVDCETPVAAVANDHKFVV